MVGLFLDVLILFFLLSIAPGGSILEEGEKSTWKTSVCVFEANDEDLKNYVQVLRSSSDIF